jgi:hypothetical protein
VEIVQMISSSLLNHSISAGQFHSIQRALWLVLRKCSMFHILGSGTMLFGRKPSRAM